jgi:hypothetical protein
MTRVGDEVGKQGGRKSSEPQSFIVFAKLSVAGKFVVRSRLYAFAPITRTEQIGLLEIMSFARRTSGFSRALGLNREACSDETLS